MTTTLNIIGPGRVGRTLGTLLQRAGLCAVQDVLSAEMLSKVKTSSIKTRPLAAPSCDEFFTSTSGEKRVAIHAAKLRR